MATRTFGYTGSVQTFVVPAQCTDVYMLLEGAGGDFNSGDGGSGGRVEGHKTVSPGDVLRVYVGGAGSGGNGGWNGGGDGGTVGTGGSIGAGGGGGTDVRLGGTGYANRIATAGGGGGQGRPSGSGGNGGQGGAATGQQGGGGSGGTHAGGGGQAAAGGLAGTGSPNGTAGALGQGGHGGNTGTAGASGGGGGGGGLYGGGGGGTVASGTSGGGGGGSNDTSGLTTVITNARGSGAAAGANGSVVFEYNLPPNVPALSATAVSGSAAGNFDKTKPLTLNITYSDPDNGSSITDALFKIDVRWRIGTGAWTTIAAVVPGTTVSAGSLDNPADGTNWHFAFANDYFDAYVDNQVETQVQTYDSFGASSGWSSSIYATPRTKPAAATIITPVSGDTIESRTPTVTWTTPVPMVRWQLAVFDSGGVELLGGLNMSPFGGPTSGNGQTPDFAYVNHTFYKLGVRYQQVNGVWSDWTLTAALEASIAAPLQPTLVLTPDNDTASVRIDITNPGSDPFPPLHNDVFRQNLDDGGEEVRIETNVAINGSYTDFTPGNRSSYRYRVNAVNATTYTSSE